MTVGEALAFAKKELYSVPDRDVDSAWIVAYVADIKRSMLRLDADKELTPFQEEKLRAIVERRKTREPLQYIFGFVPFYNIALHCDERALIPRDETSLVVERAMELIKKHSLKTVLDIGTGTGAIALTVKHNMPEVRVTASDISEKALSLAQENAKALSLEVELIKSDLFESISGKFDMIISNPPYISSADMEKLERELSFEPRNALEGGADGLDFYRDIMAEAREHLNENGIIVFEIGYDQGSALKALFAKYGFIDSVIEKDYSGIDRIAISSL